MLSLIISAFFLASIPNDVTAHRPVEAVPEAFVVEFLIEEHDPALPEAMTASINDAASKRRLSTDRVATWSWTVVWTPEGMRFEKSLVEVNGVAAADVTLDLATFVKEIYVVSPGWCEYARVPIHAGSETPYMGVVGNDRKVFTLSKLPLDSVIDTLLAVRCFDGTGRLDPAALAVAENGKGQLVATLHQGNQRQIWTYAAGASGKLEEFSVVLQQGDKIVEAIRARVTDHQMIDGVAVPAEAEWIGSRNRRLVLRLVSFARLEKPVDVDELRIVWPPNSQVQDQTAGRLAVTKERGLFTAPVE